jgi:ankyrin repeat protein
MPLHLAAKSSHQEIVSSLLDRGADLEAKDEVGLFVSCLVRIRSITG